MPTTPGNDTLDGTPGNDTLSGLDGNDIIRGLAGSDVLNGDDGNDRLEGGADIDTLNGGGGDDRLYGGSVPDDGTYSDALYGGSGADELHGGAGSFLYGEADNDTIFAGASSTVDAGSGDDRVIISGAIAGSGPLSVDGGIGTDTVVVTSLAADFVLPVPTRFERLEFLAIATASYTIADDVFVSGGSYALFFSRRTAGSFLFDGSAETDARLLITIEGLTGTIRGGRLNDEITGGLQGDTLSGNGGDDMLFGTGGMDVLAGGSGGDRLVGDAGDDILRGEAGADVLEGDDGVDSLNGGDADDTLLGGLGDDELTGGSGDDRIDGGAGMDTAMFSGRREDYTITFGNGSITVVGADGTDTLFQVNRLTFSNKLIDVVPPGITHTGTPDADTIIGTEGTDTLSGDASNDELAGLEAADVLDGGDGNDVLTGGSGDDILTGGAGDDDLRDDANGTLEGGAGNDRLTGGHSLSGGSGNDTLTDGYQVHYGSQGLLPPSLIAGEDGDDTIGIVSAVRVLGGEGNDTLYLHNDSEFPVSNFNSTVIYDGGAGYDVLYFSGSGYGFDTIVRFEEFFVSDTTILPDSVGVAGNVVTISHVGPRYEVGHLIDASAETDAVYHINGSPWADTLKGGQLADVIKGGHSSDSIFGNAGNDELFGDNRDDLLVGGSGNDRLDGGDFVDTAQYSGNYADYSIIFDNENGLVYVSDLIGGDGTDTLRLIEKLQFADGIIDIPLPGVVRTGGADTDEIVGEPGDDTLSGGGGNDTLNGMAGEDTVNGDDGDDLIIDDSGLGNDVYDGGEGIDTIRYANKVVSIDLNNGTATGAGTDTLIGFENAIGGSGRDMLVGSSGDNVLDGGSGADVLSGGTGNDTYIVDNSGDRAFETTTTSIIDAGGVDIVQSAVNYNLNFNAGLRFVENLTLTGAANISGTGNARANTLIGNAGNNTLNGGLGVDMLLGGAGNDTYVVDNSGDRAFETTTMAKTIDAGGIDTVQSAVSYNLDFTAGLRFVEDLTLTGTGNIKGKGNGLANTLTGNIGDNVLDGGTGADMLVGGAGNDIYIVDNSGDRAFETTAVASTIDAGGIDTVQSSVGYKLDFNAGLRFVENLTLLGTTNIDGTGNSLANTMIGNTGDNILNGGLGVDMLLGGAGNDIYIVDNSGDRAFETTTIAGFIDAGGIDTVRSAVNYNLDFNAGLRFVENLTLLGTTNINGTGNSLANTMIGNTGNNILNGGLGIDQFYGGSGDDTFVFRGQEDTGLAAARDVIKDFEDFAGNDTIDLSAFRGALTYVGQSGFSAANQVRAIQSGADVLIQINTAGTGGAEAEILLKGTAIGMIDAGDFIG